jgi:iron(III) transport system substrate-binding protein
VKVLGTVAAVAIMLAAAGCGGDSGSAGDTGVLNVADHNALVAQAEKEGSVTVSTSFTEDSIPLIKKGFEAKYPKIKLNITEQTGDDDKRLLLEIQSEQSDIDVMHLSAESYKDYLPYVAKIDLLKLSKDGVVTIPQEMINPVQPGTMAAGSGIGGIAWNPKVLPENLVPKSWDDLLKPEFKGRKYMVDIEPANLAVLGAAWGEDKLLDFAAKIKDQNPIWVRGDTNSLTLMASGEFGLHAFSNYHSAYRVTLKSDNIKVGLLDPVPVRLTQIQAIRNKAEHPAAAALFIEYTASAEAQKVLDEDEPMQSSIYAPGSKLNELIKGKQTSVLAWKDFDNQPKWESDIVRTWGFPSAEVKEK